ncbi:MAG: hypothetical protein IJP80_09030 [Bacteroidales bacterium]|nr:hypothetical protein [Bacteroidales bacterium]
MKHLKLFTLLAIAATALTGCTKEYITEEYITNATQVFTHEYTIVPNDWHRNQGNEPGMDNYIYATFENSDITDEVDLSGSVTADAWLIYNNGDNLSSWHPLPYVYPIEINVTNDDGTTGIAIVPETLRMEWEIGTVTFIIQDLDGYDPEDMSGTITVRVNVIKNL